MDTQYFVFMAEIDKLADLSGIKEGRLKECLTAQPYNLLRSKSQLCSVRVNLR